jgi:TonB family protein
MDTSPICSDWAGKIVDGRFTLQQWLGGSAGSEVFLTDLEGHPPRKAVLKLIAADAVDAEAQINCWTSTAALSHPHLIGLFHTGRCQVDNAQLLYAVTEYADEVLSQVLAERPLTIAETEEMLDPVVDALAYLHKNGVVHGRLKPANILAVDDRLKISSERLRFAAEQVNPVASASAFDAPEAAAGTISPAVDVWSLGVTLIQALTQHPPVWEREKGRDPIVPESIPQPFADIARGCLRRDPARRYTLGDVKARLAAGRFLPVPAVNNTRRGTGKLGVTLSIAAILVVIGVIAAMQWRSRETPASPSANEQPAAETTSLPSQPSKTGTQTSPQSRSQATPASPQPAQKKPAAGIAMASSQSPAPQAQSSNRPAMNGAVVQRVLPDVLPTARESIRGKVDVGIRVAVDPRGNVSNATFDSPATSRYFGKIALQAAQQWKFNPAQVNGQLASSEWILQFEFTQAGTEITPIEVSP